MTDYHVYGGCIRSELELPDLRPALGRTPDWHLHCRFAPAPPRPGTTLGASRVDEDVAVRMERNDSGYRLIYDDTGVFDVTRQGREVEWYRPKEVDERAAATDVLGRVLCTAQHAAGLVCVHASAVVLRDGAVAFMGPRYHGKSTLAAALTLRGARLLTDDALPIEPGEPPVARPGVHGVRLWGDAAGRVGEGFAQRTVAVGGKTLLTHLPRELVSLDSHPLTAIYLLSPREAQAESPAALREQLPAFRAAAALVGQTKIGDLLGGDEAAPLMKRALAVAGSVPVYLMEYVRDFERQDEALETILGWHPLATPQERVGA